MDYRLKKEKDFNLVFKKGKKVYPGSLTMVYIESDELKAGFAVGKKHGCSVKRNRLKRVLRESFRSFIPYISKNFYFVFIPRVSDKELPTDTYKKDMGYVFKKCGII